MQFKTRDRRGNRSMLTGWLLFITLSQCHAFTVSSCMRGLHAGKVCRPFMHSWKEPMSTPSPRMAVDMPVDASRQRRLAERRTPPPSQVIQGPVECDIPRSCLSLGALLVTGLLCLATPVQAEGRTGAQVFSQKCAACHANGGNVLNGAKTLKTDALAKYGYDDLDKVIEIVTKGKAPMPSYGIKSKKLGLDPDEIEAVATYVLERAEAEWQNPAASPAQ